MYVPLGQSEQATPPSMSVQLLTDKQGLLEQSPKHILIILLGAVKLMFKN